MFGLYFLWVSFSFIFLGAIFHGGSFNILIDLLFELSLLSLWIFSRSFMNKVGIVQKEPDTADVKKNYQYKDWF
jgi:hypothetical protein